MQHRLVAVGCAAVLCLSCVSILVPVQVSAADAPTYSDYVDYFMSMDSKPLDGDFFVIITGYCPWYSASSYYRYGAYCVSAPKYLLGSDTLEFEGDSVTLEGRAIRIQCTGESSDGYIFTASTKALPVTLEFSSSANDNLVVRTPFGANSRLYWYTNSLNGTEADWTIEHFVTNIDINPASWKDVEKPDSIIINVNLTPESSKKAIDGGGIEEPTQGAGSGFELPPGWMDGGMTLETDQVSFPDNVDPDAALNVMDEFSPDSLEAYSAGFGFFWALVSKVFTTMDIWFLVYFSLLFAFIAWFFGR